MKNSDTYLKTESYPLYVIGSPESIAYVIGSCADVFAGNHRDIYIYIDDIRYRKRYMFTSDIFRALDTRLYTETSPLFCFSPQFYELLNLPYSSFPIICPDSVLISESLRVKSFIRKHSALSRVRAIFTTK